MALHGGASATIGAYFRCLGNAYQIANDILNFQGDDGAATIGSDLGRRAPNAVVVLFRDSLTAEKRSVFDSWYASGSSEHLAQWQDAITESAAMKVAAVRMHGMLDESERLAASLPGADGGDHACPADAGTGLPEVGPRADTAKQRLLKIDCDEKTFPRSRRQ